MKSIKVLLSTALCTCLVSAFAQVTLDEVLSQARNHAPEYAITSLLERRAVLESANIRSQRLPQVSVSGQSTYQSDVTSVGIDLPGVTIESPSKFQYKVQGEVNQMLYDGGTVAQLEKASGIANGIANAQVEIQLEQIRAQAITLFFGIIESQSGIDILQYKVGQIAAQRDVLDARVQNGAVLESELHTLDAARLAVENEQIRIDARRKMWIQSLSLLTGQDYPAQTVFVLPSIPQPLTEVKGLAYDNLLDFQRQGVDIDLALKRASSRPKVSVFGQLGAGQPGLNFLDRALSEYYIVGMRVQMQLGRIYTHKNDTELAVLKRDNLSQQRAVHDRRVELKKVQYQNEIQQYAEIIRKSEALLELRREITAVARVQLENGAITSAQYIDALNDENVAQAGLEQARTRKVLTQYLLQHVAGNYQKIN